MACRTMSPPMLCPMTEMWRRLGVASTHSLTSSANRIPHRSIPSNVCEAEADKVKIAGYLAGRPSSSCKGHHFLGVMICICNFIPMTPLKRFGNHFQVSKLPIVGLVGLRGLRGEARL